MRRLRCAVRQRNKRVRAVNCLLCSLIGRRIFDDATEQTRYNPWRLRKEGLARVDIYAKAGKFYVVPVYPMQLARRVAPSRAIVYAKPEDQWLLLDESFTFCFSLYKDTYVIAEKSACVKRATFSC